MRLEEILKELKDLKNEVNQRIDSVIDLVQNELNMEDSAFITGENKTVKETTENDSVRPPRRKTFRELVAAQRATIPSHTSNSHNPSHTTVDNQDVVTRHTKTPDMTAEDITTNQVDLVDQFLHGYESDNTNPSLDKLVLYAKADVGTAREVLRTKLENGSIKPIKHPTKDLFPVSTPDLTKMSPSDIRAMASSIMTAAESLEKSISNVADKSTIELNTSDIADLDDNMSVTR